MRVAPRSVPLSLLFVVLRASPSTPGLSAHLRPRFVALREELDHSKAGERGGKEQCALFVGEVPLEAELMISASIHIPLCPPLIISVMLLFVLFQRRCTLDCHSILTDSSIFCY